MIANLTIYFVLYFTVYELLEYLYLYESFHLFRDEMHPFNYLNWFHNWIKRKFTSSYYYKGYIKQKLIMLLFWVIFASQLDSKVFFFFFKVFIWNKNVIWDVVKPTIIMTVKATGQNILFTDALRKIFLFFFFFHFFSSPRHINVLNLVIHIKVSSMSLYCLKEILFWGYIVFHCLDISIHLLKNILGAANSDNHE